MARAGSSKKAVYVTHKKQSPLQRAINKATGVRESKTSKAAKRARAARKQAQRRLFTIGKNAES